jgi:2-polyprenyl-3-methyl-5-hydroxy-6-metoxy-1,4-benzoquinol methylase
MQRVSSNLKSPHPAVVDVLARKSAYQLKFEDGNQYDSKMWLAYSRTVRDLEALGRNMKVLEIGAFTGIVSAALANLGHDVTASDIPFVLADERNAAFLRSEGVKTMPHDLSILPFPAPSSEFDLVVMNEVLEHLNFNPIPLLRELARVLKPGGLLYCATPNLSKVHSRLRLLRGQGIMNPISHLVLNLKPETGMSVGLHWREWTKDEMVQLFKKAGFSVKSHKYGVYTNNVSPFPRKQLIGLMYALAPSLMANQVGVFVRN